MASGLAIEVETYVMCAIRRLATLARDGGTFVVDASAWRVRA
ncbi:hypothetical protein [Dyella choica]|nr:hypothetical protein [Dyella choica]